MAKFLLSLLSPRSCIGRRAVPRLWTAGPALSQAFSNQLSERSVALDFILRSVLESPRNLGLHDVGEEDQEKKREKRESKEGEREGEEKTGGREKERWWEKG